MSSFFHECGKPAKYAPTFPNPTNNPLYKYSTSRMDS